MDGRSKSNGPRPDTLTGALIYPDGNRAAFLPTPNATDWKGSNTPKGRSRGGRPRTMGDADLPAAIDSLPTPRGSGGSDIIGLPPSYTRGKHGLDLGPAIGTLFKTPTAQLAVNGGSQHPDKRRAGGHGPTLADQVEHELLPTPTASLVNPPAPWKPGVQWWLQSRAARNVAAIAQRLVTDAGWVDWGKYARAVLLWQQVLGRMVPYPLEPGSKNNAVLSPVFVEWMMGVDEGWVTDCPGLSRNAKLRILGNGVVPQQAELGICILLWRLSWNATS